MTVWLIRRNAVGGMAFKTEKMVRPRVGAAPARVIWKSRRISPVAGLVGHY
jgi:hypothetical protein